MKIINPDEIDAVSKAVEIDNLPLQRPDRDELVQSVRVAGPLSGLDTRMYLDVAILEAFLDVAHASPVGRVQLGLIGLEVETYRKRKRDGSYHQYQVWKLTAGQLRPEVPAILQALNLTGLKGPGGGK